MRSACGTAKKASERTESAVANPTGGVAVVVVVVVVVVVGGVVVVVAAAAAVVVLLLAAFRWNRKSSASR